jgi:tRNA modification GTPase
MLSRGRDTIVALSTPPGRGGIAVLRLSGPRAHALAEARFEPVNGRTPPRLPQARARFGRICTAAGAPLDEGLLLAFHAPRSASGEDLAEFHLHGSPLVVERLLADLLEEAVPALPGEFTRRAVENGRLDLAQAEAIHALIEARSEWAHDLALRALSGETRRRVEEARRQLVGLLAQIEAELDFAAEDIPPSPAATLLAELAVLADRLGSWRRSWQAGRLAAGAQVVLLGVPNAGKSTLMNALLGQDRVLVDERPGTTRDAVSQSLRLGGLELTLWDTAGLRETEDRLERAGIDRSHERAAAADLLLLLLPPEAGEPPPLGEQRAPLILLGSQADRCPERPAAWQRHPGLLPISARTGQGLDELRRRMVAALLSEEDRQRELVLSEWRQVQHLDEARRALERATAGLASGQDRSLVASDLREAAEELGAIHGGYDTEDMLDEVFSRFCIGK